MTINSPEIQSSVQPSYEATDAILQQAAPDSLLSGMGQSEQDKLQAAFEFFNQMSEQLTHAYQDLEQQVKQLTQELEQTREQHHQEVQNNQRVTGRLESLLNILPVGVVRLDVRGCVQACNQAAIDLLGEPLEGMLWLDIIQRCFAPRFDDGHEVSLKDGRRVSIATRSLEVEPGQLVVLTDMTQNRLMQDRLSHMQRLSALGKMVASLAHQIRTPLSTAMLYGEHLVAGDLTQEKQKKFAGKLMSRLQHLEHQVRDMLIFARGQMPINDQVTTEELLQGILAAMEAPLETSGASSSLNNQATGLTVRCNREALIGAVMNLVNNAIESAQQADGLTGAVSDLKLELNLIQSGDHLELSVTDNGPGMDAETCHQVTEPFMTTKGQGTGLGLSVVKAVARAHQGEFLLTSKPGQGTHATLRLPLLQQSISDPGVDGLSNEFSSTLGDAA